jgi:hypothetical protein
MGNNVSLGLGKKARDLLEKLAPIGEIDGVSDYLLVDSEGKILARKPQSSLAEDVAVACARDMAQIGETLRLLSCGNESDGVFDVQFKGTLLIGWLLGSCYIFAFCKQGVNLPIMRMTVNIVKEELGKDKRFKKYLSERVDGDSHLLSEHSVGSELYKHVTTLKQE